MQRKCTNLCASLKADYISNKINDKGSQKVLFNITHSLLHRNKPQPLPTHLDPHVLADEFADYFVGNITMIQEAFPDPVRDCRVNSNVMMDLPTIDSIVPTTFEELKKIIL